MLRHTAAVSRGDEPRARRGRHAVHELPAQCRARDAQRGSPTCRGWRARRQDSRARAVGVSPSTSELVEAGVPVMGHVGLTPAVRERAWRLLHASPRRRGAAKLLEDCLALAGRRRVRGRARMHPGRARASRRASCSTIPTIGIGAGVGCDGQVQVFHDLLGIGEFMPEHAKRYAELVGDDPLGGRRSTPTTCARGRFPARRSRRTSTRRRSPRPS